MGGVSYCLRNPWCLGRCQEGLGWLLYRVCHIGHMAGFYLLKVKGFFWTGFYSRIGPDTSAEMQELSQVSGV